MDWVYLLLGLVQGLTEFLPVSSSGHLILFEKHLKAGFSDSTLLFMNVIFHMGTLLAVFVFFRREIFAYVRESYAWLCAPSWSLNELQKEVMFVVVITIPTGVIGLTLKKMGVAHASLQLVSILLMVTALISFVIDRVSQKNESMCFRKAMLLGVVQGIAVLPGITRSGSTILAGLLLGISREKMASFSFLMSIPAISGAFLLEIKDALESGISQADFISLAGGFFVAFLSGWLSLYLLIHLLKKQGFWVFGVYCALVSVTFLVRG